MVLGESVALKTYTTNMRRLQESLQAVLRDYSQLTFIIKQQF